MERDLLFREAQRLVDEAAPEILAVSRDIFTHPELAFHEEHAAALLEQTVTAQGFTARRGEGELHTALRAEHAPVAGNLNIAFISEYDALPVGHACGHNLIAAPRKRAAAERSRCWTPECSTAWTTP